MVGKERRSVDQINMKKMTIIGNCVVTRTLEVTKRKNLYFGKLIQVRGNA